MAKKFHHSHEVCACKQVTLGEIIHAINENGASTLKEIGDSKCPKATRLKEQLKVKAEEARHRVTLAKEPSEQNRCV